MLRSLWNWLASLVPSDEMLEAAPENDADIRERMNRLEATRALARCRVEELNTTTSPIHRRSA